MIENSKCVACKSIFSADDFSIFDKKCFLEIYLRGGLTIPSANLWEFVCETFSILDYFDKIILKKGMRYNEKLTFVYSTVNNI